jgi:hypothetical protein
MDDSQRKSRGDCRVHGIAALAHDVRTNLGSLLVNAHHYGLAGVDWPQTLSVAQFSRHAADNQLTNQKFTQNCHLESRTPMS